MLAADDDDERFQRRGFFPRYRLGAEAVYDRGRFTVQSEVMSGEDASNKRLGGYLLVAYRIRSKLEVVAQIDLWDPSLSEDDDRRNASEADFLLGANYYVLRNNLNFQANLIQRTYAGEDPPNRVALLLNAQAHW